MADNVSVRPWSERVILITGAGSGIGRVVAKGCADAGATVILLGKRLRTLEKVYDEIIASGAREPALYPMNLEGATPQDYQDLAATLEREFGRLDGLLHNAVMMDGLRPLEHFPPELWMRQLQVNLNAPFLMTQALLPLLKKSDHASVLFTVDSVSDQGKAYWGSYAIAKSGLKTLTRMLANELKTQTTVRVNSIDPGTVRSGLRYRTYPSGDVNQWQMPESVLPAYLHLLGPDSVAVRGQCLRAGDLVGV